MYIKNIVYMLQAAEYNPTNYLQWYWRTNNFNSVSYRKKLKLTQKAKGLLFVAWAAKISILVVGFLYAYDLYETGHKLDAALRFLAIFIVEPVFTAHVLVIPLFLGYYFIQKPIERQNKIKAKEIFHSTKAKKIAVLGSYGKTSMKEILLNTLKDYKNTAATPGNMNTSTAHVRFANNLAGNEEILIVEFGEFKPDDIPNFVEMIKPDILVVTGLNGSHLDTFKTIEAIEKSMQVAINSVDDDKIFYNADDENLVKLFAGSNAHGYSHHGISKFETLLVKPTLEGISFTLKHGSKKVKITSGLLGAHNVGPLACAYYLAVAVFEINSSDAVASISLIEPVEHRLFPRKQPGGATIIDDTYNGSIDGIKAGLNLLNVVSAKRKIYVTPGLVEQGHQTIAVHHQIGRYVATVADVIYLMKNSVTEYIVTGLGEGGFDGELMIIEDPLEFYTNLDQLTKPGDVVLMQNDWTDNYN